MTHPTNTDTAGDTTPDGLNAMQFEKGRRKPNGSLAIAMRGFGKSGGFTLFLPPSKTERVMRFKDGKPASMLAEGRMDDADLLKLAEKIVRSSMDGAPGVLIVDTGFYEYAASLISRTYEVTDDDLTFLLSGPGWHEPMYRHLLELLSGGSTLKNLAAALTIAPPRQADPIHPAHVVPDPQRPSLSARDRQPRPRWWHRFTRR